MQLSTSTSGASNAGMQLALGSLDAGPQSRLLQLSVIPASFDIKCAYALLTAGAAATADDDPPAADLTATLGLLRELQDLALLERSGSSFQMKELVRNAVQVRAKGTEAGRQQSSAAKNEFMAWAFRQMQAWGLAYNNKGYFAVVHVAREQLPTVSEAMKLASDSGLEPRVAKKLAVFCSDATCAVLNLLGLLGTKPCEAMLNNLRARVLELPAVDGSPEAREHQALHANLLYCLGCCYGDMGREAEKAVTMTQGSLKIREGLANGKDTVDTLCCRSKLAVFRKGVILSAEPSRGIPRNWSPATVEAVATVLQENREVLRLRTEILWQDPVHTVRIESMVHLGADLVNLVQRPDLVDPDEAERLLLEAKAICKDVFGEGNTHPLTTTALSSLAALYMKETTKKNYDEAARNFREVLDDRVALLGEKHPTSISALNKLGACLAMRALADTPERPLPDRSLDMAKALDMICQAVLLAREVMGGDHPEAKPCISNLKGMCFAAVDSELLEESHSSVLAAKKLVEVA